MSFLDALQGFRSVIQGFSQAGMMATARTEPNPIVRQQKIQMVLQLPYITDPVIRQQMVTEIIHRSQ